MMDMTRHIILPIELLVVSAWPIVTEKQSTWFGKHEEIWRPLYLNVYIPIVPGRIGRFDNPMNQLECTISAPVCTDIKLIRSWD